MDERLSALEFRRKPRPSAESERALADLVRSMERPGARFRRHHAVGPYVLDWYCPEHRLAIEIEPSPRLASEHRFHDQVRTRYLAVSGIRVLAFAEAAIVQDGRRVAQDIAGALARSSEQAPARGGPRGVRR